MDIVTFKAELKEALAQVLIALADNFSAYEMMSFDLGIHPWHGYIEPSFLTTQDTVGLKEIGSWMLYNFADTNIEKWSAVKHLAEWMRSFYELDPEQHLIQLFIAAAEVVKSPEVLRAFKHYRTTPYFFVSVYNPDDSTFSNYCA
ncbi:hypothetical protein HA050_05510 [Iodobacter sp. HSC-16F04]|uniref:Uncharacterized protein n=1 Tax=Iodobacter violaceini TaxID=3044271 RepID=A0ABX0KU49_9NEIS|nr:hypothetical protein [Iodobacter violacea]NHQ85574.1 hypothetical protein [Iodobacter violacea]